MSAGRADHQLSAVTVMRVVAWADEVILHEQSPDMGLIELALVKKSSEATKWLNQLSFGYDEQSAFRMLFGLLHTGLLEGCCEYEEVAKRLYFWHAYESELSGYSELIYFWDALDLATEGSGGDLQDVRQELLTFLALNKS